MEGVVFMVLKFYVGQLSTVGVQVRRVNNQAFKKIPETHSAWSYLSRTS